MGQGRQHRCHPQVAGLHVASKGSLREPCTNGRPGPALVVASKAMLGPVALQGMASVML